MHRLRKIGFSLVVTAACSGILCGCGGGIVAPLVGAALISQAPRLWSSINGSEGTGIEKEKVINISSHLSVLGNSYHIRHDIRGGQCTPEFVQQAGQLGSGGASGRGNLQSQFNGPTVSRMFSDNPEPAITALVQQYRQSGPVVNLNIQFNGTLTRKNQEYDLVGIVSGTKNQQSFRQDVRENVPSLDGLHNVYTNFFYR